MGPTARRKRRTECVLPMVEDFCPRCLENRYLVALRVDPAPQLGLVAECCRRLGVPEPVNDSEEFADGCLGLLHACQRYQMKRPTVFSTYAWRCIVGYMRNGRRRRAVLRRNAEAGGAVQQRRWADRPTHTHLVEVRLDAAQLLANCDALDRWVVEQVWGHEESCRSLAPGLACSYGSVHNRSQRGLREARASRAYQTYPH